jgi:Flp pilus assembly protein TadG
MMMRAREEQTRRRTIAQMSKSEGISKKIKAIVLPTMLSDETGSSLVEMALLLPVLILLLMGVADFGRAYYLAIEVSHAASTAAIYGSQYPPDTSGMKYAAVQDAAVQDAQDVPGFSRASVVVTSGCECSDGSSAIAACTGTPACANNVVNYVQVNTTASYRAMLPYPGIPSPITLKGSARIRAGQ